MGNSHSDHLILKSKSSALRNSFELPIILLLRNVVSSRLFRPFPREKPTGCRRVNTGGHRDDASGCRNDAPPQLKSLLGGVGRTPVSAHELACSEKREG